MTIAYLEWFTNKNKLIIYIGAFVKLYNWRNRGKVYKIYEIIELEKMRVSTAKYPRNLNLHFIGNIS